MTVVLCLFATALAIIALAVNHEGSGFLRLSDPAVNVVTLVLCVQLPLLVALGKQQPYRVAWQVVLLLVGAALIWGIYGNLKFGHSTLSSTHLAVFRHAFVGFGAICLCLNASIIFLKITKSE